MTFITKSNSVGILRKVDFQKAKALSGDVYKMPIYFFSDYERNVLLGVRKLYENPDEFVKEYYVPIIREDKHQFVFEGGKPAFHNNPTCERLNSNYINFEIPEYLKERARLNGGAEAESKLVQDFRAWFKKYMYLLKEDKKEEFVKKLDARFNYSIDPKGIEISNSGAEVKENLDLPELELRIDEIIRQAGKFYKDNPDKQEIIRRFAKYAWYFSRPHVEIKNNDTLLSDHELKDFLNQYDQKFKLPLKALLLEYYRVLYNPDLKFEGKLLESLGFQKCKACYPEEVIAVL